MPAAALGARTLQVLPSHWVDIALGIFAFVRKVVVQRMSTNGFQHILDALLLCSGLSLLWVALTR